MENEIIEYKAGELASQKVHFEKTGLAIDQDLSQNEWAEIGAFLKQAERSVGWWIGDWINFGERKFGEKYSQEVDQLDYERKTLWNYAYVARSILPSFRKEGLSFQHHNIVASLPKDKQQYWLDYADDHKLTTRELVAAIHTENLKEEGSNYDNLVDFIEHMKAYANEVLQLADALHEKRIFVSPNQKQIILDQASLIHGLWDNLEYELRKG